MQKSFIELKDLSKSYQEGGKDRDVLRGASAKFDQGEFSAILGRSGSGKSTLLNIISGIDYADQGEVWMGGVDLNSLNENDRTLFRRDNIGFIFQFFNLIPTLTVLENVTLPMELSGSKVSFAKETAANLLDQVELGDRLDTFPDRLSGGEQQRVAIARALVNDPLLVLADEPTGNLDRKTGKIILELLDNLTRKAGKNLILVTHSQDSSNYASNVHQLQGGKLIAEKR
jgi:putative ABC transport system ATP-binding protein